MEMPILIFIAFWLVAASIARYRENVKIRKLTEPMVKAHGESAATMAENVTKMMFSQARVEAFLKEVLDEDPLPPVEATRVYAAILRSGSAFRLHMLPALSVAEFKDKSEAVIGKGWTADVIEYLDIKPLKEKVVYKEKPLAEKKDMGLKEGLYFLQLARDRFAKTKAQEVAMDKIINNYKYTYELV